MNSLKRPRMHTRRSAWSSWKRPLLIIDDLGLRKLPLTAAEELLEIIMRRDERASTLPATNFLL